MLDKFELYHIKMACCQQCYKNLSNHLKNKYIRICIVVYYVIYYIYYTLYNIDYILYIIYHTLYIRVNFVEWIISLNG